jgi:hypothetical protein
MKVVAVHRVVRRPDPKAAAQTIAPGGVFECSGDEFEQLTALGAIRPADKVDIAKAEARGAVVVEPNNSARRGRPPKPKAEDQLTAATAAETPGTAGETQAENPPAAPKPAVEDLV